MKKTLNKSDRLRFIDSQSLFDYAVEELKRNSELINEKKLNDQFYRRLFFKNIYSLIETYINTYKKIIVSYVLIENKNTILNWEELIILNETKVKLDTKGKIKISKEFQQFEPNLRFTLNTFSKVFGIDKPNYGDTGFQKLITLSKRRNDITHPRNINNLKITTEEIKGLFSAYKWFINETDKMNIEYIEWLKTI